jgi:hypothetical protein
MKKIQITGRDWDMTGCTAEEITVEGPVAPLEGCGANADRAAVVDAYGRDLRIVGIRRHGARVELAVDIERPPAGAAGPQSGPTGRSPEPSQLC